MARGQKDYQIQQAKIVRLSSMATRDLPEAQRKIVFDIKAIEIFLSGTGPFYWPKIQKG